MDQEGCLLAAAGIHKALMIAQSAEGTMQPFTGSSTTLLHQITSLIPLQPDILAVGTRTNAEGESIINLARLQESLMACSPLM
jgi:hypothetical protein